MDLARQERMNELINRGVIIPVATAMEPSGYAPGQTIYITNISGAKVLYPRDALGVGRTSINNSWFCPRLCLSVDDALVGRFNLLEHFSMLEIAIVGFCMSVNGFGRIFKNDFTFDGKPANWQAAQRSLKPAAPSRRWSLK